MFDLGCPFSVLNIGYYIHSCSSSLLHLSLLITFQLHKIPTHVRPPCKYRRAAKPISSQSSSRVTSHGRAGMLKLRAGTVTVVLKSASALELHCTRTRLTSRTYLK